MEPLRCKMCNGPLVVDDSGEYAVCEYCGTKHTRETIQKMMKVEVINPVRIQEKPIEEKLEKVRAYLKVDQNDKALSLCEEIQDQYPDDYRGWWYQFVIESNELQNYDSALYDRLRDLLPKTHGTNKNVAKDLIKEYNEVRELKLRKTHDVPGINGIEVGFSIGAICLGAAYLFTKTDTSITIAIICLIASIPLLIWGFKSIPVYKESKRKLCEEKAVTERKIQGLHDLIKKYDIYTLNPR